MLCQRVWFDAQQKGWFNARGPRIGSFVGFKTGNWMPKTILAGKKKTNLAGFFFGRNKLANFIWRKQRIGALTKTILVGMYTTSTITIEI